MRLKLAYYDDPVLRKKTERVNLIDDKLSQLVDDMIETMLACDGVGLAAPQVHHSLNLFVTCIPFRKPSGEWIPGKPRIFINPEIISYSKELQIFSEGCLSIPNFYMNVERPKTIDIRATDIHGQIFEETLSNFEATNFMHEYDHLNGILIVDYYSPEAKKSLERLLKISKTL